MSKQYTKSELRRKGYLPASEASASLMALADQMQHCDDWIKLSLQVWYQVPKGQEYQDDVTPISVSYSTRKD